MKIPNEIRQKLRDHFQAGCKAVEERKIGVERESIVLQRFNGFANLPFVGARDGEVSISRLFQELCEMQGWQPIDADPVISLKRRGEEITLEPAGQFEIGTSPRTKLCQVWYDLKAFEKQLLELPMMEHLSVLYTGMNPLHTPEEVNWIPKQRYRFMRERFAKTGTLGSYMMSLTSATQVSLDYNSEEDCGAMLRMATLLSPLLTAIYANSPISSGKATGFISFRTHIWYHTDDSRCGIPPFFLQAENVFDAYIDYALRTPLMFRREVVDGVEQLHASDGAVTFYDFMQSHSDWSIDDWTLHLSTLFPETRLKQLVEVRTPDGTPLSLAITFPLLCKALFYNDSGRDGVEELLGKSDQRTILEAQQSAARLGLSKGRYGRFSLLDLAKEIFQLIDDAVKHADNFSDEECDRLGALAEQIYERRCSPGEEMLRHFEGPLQQDPKRLVDWLALRR